MTFFNAAVIQKNLYYTQDSGLQQRIAFADYVKARTETGPYPAFEILDTATPGFFTMECYHPKRPEAVNRRVLGFICLVSGTYPFTGTGGFSVPSTVAVGDLLDPVMLCSPYRLAVRGNIYDAATWDCVNEFGGISDPVYVRKARNQKSIKPRSSTN